MQPEPTHIPDSLTMIADTTLNTISEGGMGAVVGRAGIGKTPLIVQLALHAIIKNNNVLHVSLSQSVQKTVLWYNEICSRLAEQFPALTDASLEPFFRHRFIMTLKGTDFSVDNLQGRIRELQEQDVFSPAYLVIDGLSSGIFQRDQADELKMLGRTMNLGIWVAVGAHREEDRDKHDRPASISEVADLFDAVWELSPKPEDKRIYLESKPAAPNLPAAPTKLFLTPSSMMLNLL